MKKVFLPLLMVAILIISSMTVSAAEFEAEFNGKQYATLEEAITAASNASEGTLKLLSDVTIADLETAALITVASGQKLTVDLNGCTLDVTSDTAANTNVILNNGSLTIMDTSAAKDGKITYKYVGTSCNYGSWGTYTLTNGNGATFVLKAASTGEELGTVNKLATPIKVTVAIPENLKAENVKYVVIRDHNGVVTKLPTTVNANGTITFETDMFSTYALAVADADATAPKTGDTGMMPAAWVAIIAAAGIAFAAARRRSVVR